MRGCAQTWTQLKLRIGKINRMVGGTVTDFAELVPSKESAANNSAAGGG